MKPRPNRRMISLAATAALALTAFTANAQNVNVDATLTYAPLGGGVYSYALTLDNTGTESISSLWLGWTVNGFNIANPNNPSSSYYWFANTDGNSIEYSADYYGYQYYANLDPGYSQEFDFESTSTPAQFASGAAGPSVAYGVNANQFDFIGTTADSLQFTPQITPEPGTLALVGMGTLGLIGTLRRRFVGVK